MQLPRIISWRPISLLALLACLALLIIFLQFFPLSVDLEDHSGGVTGPVEVLFVGDPFAHAIEARLEEVSRSIGHSLRLSVRRYARTYETLLSNARDEESYFHIVSFDILWLPDLVQRGILLPLPMDELISLGFRPEEHHAATLEFNAYKELIYGLPIQSHPELLWYRRDLLEEAGFAPPATLAELVEQARYFHRPEEGFFGICWNGLRGQALGQTVTHLYAAFGQPVVDEKGRIMIDTETGREVVHFLRELITVSPPDILAMAWDQRIERFSRGQSAFTYGWMARSPAAEIDPLSRVQGRVGFIAPPGRDSGIVPTPMGQWSIGIPSNLPPDQINRAKQAMIALVSRPTEEILRQEHFFGNHLIWTAEDFAQLPEHSGPAVVQHILADRLFDAGARPSLPQWSRLADILGVVFHDLLQHELDIDEALAKAQRQAEGNDFEAP